jgi:hypothetical protein
MGGGGNGHVKGSPMKKNLWRVRGMLRRGGQLGNFYGGQSERTATLRAEFSSASLALHRLRRSFGFLPFLHRLCCWSFAYVYLLRLLLLLLSSSSLLNFF